MHCPSLTIFGTFFPSWMLCALIGIVATIGARKLFAVAGIGAELRPALILYPCIALAVTFLLWLTLYGH